MKTERKTVWAIATNDGVYYHDYHMDIYWTRKAAEAARARYNIASDGRFDGRVVRVVVLPAD